MSLEHIKLILYNIDKNNINCESIHGIQKSLIETFGNKYSKSVTNALCAYTPRSGWVYMFLSRVPLEMT